MRSAPQCNGVPRPFIWKQCHLVSQWYHYKRRGQCNATGGSIVLPPVQQSRSNTSENERTGIQIGDVLAALVLSILDRLILPLSCRKVLTPELSPSTQFSTLPLWVIWNIKFMFCFYLRPLLSFTRRTDTRLRLIFLSGRLFVRMTIGQLLVGRTIFV